MPSLMIVGDLLSPRFHEAILIGEDIADRSGVDVQLESKSLMQNEWIDYLADLKLRLNRSDLTTHSLEEPIIMHSSVGFVGGLDAFVRWAVATLKYKDPRVHEGYKEVVHELTKNAKHAFENHTSASENSFVELVFRNTADLGGEEGNPEEEIKVIVELYDRQCPKTCQNFLSLCNGNGELNPKKLSYIGSPIHRIVKDGWLQLGDIKDGSGLYGESIYGDTFPDEGFEVKHNVEGILSMANKGPHTNGSQFLITMRPLPSFDNKFVAFGRVVSGLDHIRKINAVPTLNQRPQAKIFISKANECHATRLLLNTVNVTDHQQFNSPRSINRKAATLICLGLDGAGKSTVTMNFDQHMAKDAFYAYATVGFEMEQVPYDHFDLTFFGLGGGRSFRSIWAHYFDEIFGLVYVVDSTDEKRMEESRDALISIFKHPGMEGKPVLIYANKQDGRGAMSAPEVAHFFDVDELNKTRKVRVFGSTALPSAYHSSCKESDPKLYEGMSWLCLAIENNYTALADKVDADMAAAKAKK